MQQSSGLADLGPMSASPGWRGPIRAALSAGLLAATLAALLGPLWAPSPLLHLGVPCDYAVEIDGVLSCGESAPKLVVELCPGAGIDPALQLRSGDALDTAGLCSVPASSPGGPHWSRMHPDDLAALALPVNINLASADELASLPGIGPVLAGRIVEARPFTDTQELRRVRGIGPVKLRALEPRAEIASEPSYLRPEASR